MLVANDNGKPCDDISRQRNGNGGGNHLLMA